MDVVLEMVLPGEAEDSTADSETTLLNRRQKRVSKHVRRRKEESSNTTVCPDFNLQPAQQGGRRPRGVRSSQWPLHHFAVAAQTTPGTYAGAIDCVGGGSGKTRLNTKSARSKSTAPNCAAVRCAHRRVSSSDAI